MKIFKSILASLFLLFVVSSTSLFSMESSSSTSTTTKAKSNISKNKTKSSKSTQKDTSGSSQGSASATTTTVPARVAVASVQDVSAGKSKHFYNYSVSELESCYKRSSVQVKAFIRKLCNPIYRKKPQVRSVFFLGKPGTDKTTTAVMIAYKLRDKFNFDVVDCPDLTGESRGASTVALRKRMDAVVSKNEQLADDKGIIIVLDEIQELLDHADDSHYDTASTGRYLTSWLNNHRVNDKVFLIATCNSCGTFPEQIRSRMVGHMIEFKELGNAQEKLNAFFAQMRAQGVKRYASCTPENLLAKIELLKDWVGRDFESLVSVLIDQFFEKEGTEDAQEIIVNMNDIEKAIKTVCHDKKLTKKSKDAETAQEQLERHHKENRADRESELIHKYVAARIGKFIPTNRIINAAIADSNITCLADFLKGGSSVGGVCTEDLKEVLQIMTDSQIAYLDNVIREIRRKGRAFESVAAIEEASREQCSVQ